MTSSIAGTREWDLDEGQEDSPDPGRTLSQYGSSICTLRQNDAQVPTEAEQSSMTDPTARPLPFPPSHPEGFPPLEDEPTFDPGRHLALEAPDRIFTLTDFGYSDAEAAACPSALAATSAFRILSDEGVACLQEVTRRLEPYARGIERISRMVRGGVYQSRFLRDLCFSPELAEAMSGICKTRLLPHTMPHQLGHLNFAPQEVGENVDKWHTDTLRFDFVLFVTDPTKIAGGEFEYFHGTKHEVAELSAKGRPLPEDKIVSVAPSGAGYGVMQQGNMVVHRAKALTAPGERITLVNGYVPADLSYPDFTRFDQLFLADPPHVATSEYARHVAWMGRELLESQLQGNPFSSDRAYFAERLEAVAELLSKAAEEIRSAGSAKMEHFGDG